MDAGNQLILIGAGLVFISIFAGLVSSRIGAPLLLVFLGLGMLAGKDGPGGLEFDDFGVAFTIGATALAIVLFDGGLRTHRETLRHASWPALTLATVGVLLTAILTGLAARAIFGLAWLESLLVGSIVASTDAAAVFFLLHLRGTNLVKRVRATLEAESGMNDPMAVFLTITCVELLRAGADEFLLTWAAALQLLASFAVQILGGAVIGIVGGFALVWLINATRLATGLYPILALSGALLIFAGAQNVGASGFLAAYLAGFVLGNQRHRATQIVDRFQDGVAWLSQIVMFLMLGLLVTPSRLLDTLLPALGIALFLIVLGRPLAVAICLLPFRFTWRERAFVSWVGLRGAVPIFLGTVPVLAGLPNAMVYFEIAFVVVLTSLLIQGWTINVAARRLNLALPPEPAPSPRFDVDLPSDVGRDMAAYTIQETSLAVGRRPADLPLSAEVDIISVIRDGAMRSMREIGALLPGDYLVLIAPPEQMAQLDRIFGIAAKPEQQSRAEAVFGEFTFSGSVKIGELKDAYDLPIPAQDKDLSLDMFMRRHLRDRPVEGDRLRLGEVELIVRNLDSGRISQVGIELEPTALPIIRRDLLYVWWRHLWQRLALPFCKLRAFRRSSPEQVDEKRSKEEELEPRPRA